MTMVVMMMMTMNVYVCVCACVCMQGCVYIKRNYQLWLQVLRALKQM